MTNIIVKIIRTALAMMVTALGISLMIRADVGMNPWWTLTFGLSQYTGLSLGLIVQFLGLIFIGLAFLLGVKPGLTTILDMFLVGFYINVLSHIQIAIPDIYIIKILLSILGIIIFCLGLSLTVSTGLGAGPKDSFTFAIVKKTKISISKVKLTIESLTFILGVILGGPFGLGTILATLLTGRLLSLYLKRLKYDPMIA